MALAAIAAVGCGDDTPPPVAQNRVVGAVVEAQTVMRPLTAAVHANPAPDTAMSRADGVTLDARLLVISADGNDVALTAITTALDYLGTPYDVLNASSGPALTGDDLATGDHGHYYGVILDSGDLAVGSSSALSDDEWMALASYEARFGARRAVLYAIPSPAYGLQSTGGFDAAAQPLAATCTAAGANVFVGTNCAAPIAINVGYVYSGRPTDASTVPLLVDNAGNVYAATRAYADGREALVLTFAQSPTAMHTLALVYGVVSWVTQGLFVGERHVYVSPQLDDFYLASAMYPSSAGVTYRCSAADLQAFADWQNAQRADPVTAGLRSAFAFNANGARPAGQDALSDKARELGPTFAWINHTWDHADLTTMAYADAFEEFSKNNQHGLGTLTPYTVENLVTPGISGLDNPEVMHAAFDVGIRQLVSDTSQPGQKNPSPNAGYQNAQVPSLLMIPRRPTDLYFNVSQPSEWIAEYAALNSVSYSYEQIIAAASDHLLRYMLRGENDPWMFHQANIRDLGGGESLFSKLIGTVLDKYKALATFPVVSPTMDELARIVQTRMAFNASGVSATIEPGGKLTVSVTNAATIPVTGVCTPGAEAYGSQTISYLNLAAGQSITVSLADCNDGIGGTGAGGIGGGDGSGTRGSLSSHGGSSSSHDSGCAVSGAAPSGGAAAVVIAVAFLIAAVRRRGSGTGRLLAATRR